MAMDMEMRNLRQRAREWDFDIDWNDVFNISPTLEERLQAGKRPIKKIRREMVRVLVRQVRNKVPHANRKIFKQVASDLKVRYPRAFKNELAKGKLGKHTMQKRMADCFDNQHRAPKKTRAESEAPNIKPAYGCKRYRVVALPDDETADSQEEHRLRLQSIFETMRPHAWPLDEIEEKMALTYGTQRKDINKQIAIIQNPTQEENVDDTTSLQLLWPFLYRYEGMRGHFNTLVGIDYEENVNYFKSNECDSFMKYLASEEKELKRMRKRMRRSEDRNSIKLMTCILMVAKYFKEDIDSIIKVVDPSTHIDNVTEQTRLPPEPCLIIAGEDIITPQKIFFSIDAIVVGTANTLEEGIGLLFMSQFVFGIVYAPKVQLTLEFMQRCIVYLNPPRGNKRAPKEIAKKAKALFSSSKVHHKLAKLEEDFTEWMAEQNDDD